MEAWADLPVFCSDGLCWTSKLIMSAVSPGVVETALESLSEHQLVEGTCLILPDVDKTEFATFQASLALPSLDKAIDKLDLSKVVKVGRLLGVADLPIVAFDHHEEAAKVKSRRGQPEIDYKQIRGNRYEWRRALRSVGYAPELGGGAVGDVTTIDASDVIIEDSKWSTSHNKKKVASLGKIAKVLETSFECAECGRSFVDQMALKKHAAMLHKEQRHFHTNTRAEDLYSCNECDKTFRYLVNVKKHKLLQHRRKP